MIFDLSPNGNTLHVTVIGGIADVDVQEMKVQLEYILHQSFDEVVFDFSQLQYMCSSSIGRMMLFYKNIRSTGRKMRVKGVTDYIQSLFEFTNLDLLFPIER